MTDATETLRKQVAWACRILGMAGHGDYTLGHVSGRDADGVYIKPNGIGLEEAAPGDILTIGFNNRKIAGAGRVHLESVLHTAVYNLRPDVNAVIHTHPPFTTAFGATDAKLELINHDAVLFHDGLAYFDDTAELIVDENQGRAVAEALGDKSVVIMRGHGVLIAERSVPWAVYTALTLERVIQLQSLATSLGRLRPMTLEMAAAVYPDKYRTEFVMAYWAYLIRKVRAAGLDTGMPECEA